MSSTMAKYEYGNTVKGQLFQTVHDLCKTEQGVTMPQHRRYVQWQADPEVFNGVFALNPVSLKYAPHGKKFIVSSFRVVLPTDEILSVEWNNGWFADTLDNDPFTIGVLNSLQKLVQHQHRQCKPMDSNALSAQAQAALALQGVHG